jgi:nucleotide-binding universal stress UspA family protein
MKPKTLLVPTDFSAGSDAALACATELAKSLGASLSIVHVEVAPVLKGPYDDEDDSLEHQERRLLDQVKPHDAAVSFERVFLKGNVLESILGLAGQRAVEMIVMGTHGQTNSPDAVLGTVAEAVTRQAPCTVLAVKPPTKVAEKASSQ